MMAVRVLSENEYMTFKKGVTALLDSPDRAVETGIIFSKFEIPHVLD